MIAYVSHFSANALLLFIKIRVFYPSQVADSSKIGLYFSTQVAEIHLFIRPILISFQLSYFHRFIYDLYILG